MKIYLQTNKKVRIEMIPLIDMIFLLLVSFIYAMLSMAVHHGLPVILPPSSSAIIEKELVLSVTVKADGTIFINEEPVVLDNLATALTRKAEDGKQPGVLLFADRNLSYQKLFRVLDQIRTAGIERISLQAEVNPST
uniref:Biopolymer transporter ExbD n=1 Tax=Candidatus Desulfatibia profunda TaxID=2841695 RepID=A0A8J6NTL2_9BACT|nr:biopolymer transporter ExbD [Candidatus Desulfatibia profunda]